MFQKGLTVCFVWVSAHVGVEGNEDVDFMAKKALKVKSIDMQIPLSKAVGKAFIKEQMQNKWQEYWELNETGRHLYNIQKNVGLRKKLGRS